MNTIKGVLRKVENYESNTDRKFVISVTKEACPDNILKYQHEEVGVILEWSAEGHPEITVSRQEQLQVLLGHADTIADAAMKLTAMVKQELQKEEER